MSAIPGNGKIVFEKKSGYFNLVISEPVSISDGASVKLGVKPSDMKKIIGKDITGYIGFVKTGLYFYRHVSFDISFDDRGFEFDAYHVDIDGTLYTITIYTPTPGDVDSWNIECSEET